MAPGTQNSRQTDTPILFYKQQFISNALLITSRKKSQKSLLKKGKIRASLESETSWQLATMLIEKNGWRPQMRF